MNHPHLELRGKVFAYRRKIPLDLLAAYPGRIEIRHSLKTRDKSEAIRLARLRSVELDDEFQRQRRKRAQLRPQPHPAVAVALNDENIRRLCLLWTRTVLETDDTNRSSGFDLTDYSELSDTLTETGNGLKELLGRGKFDAILPALTGFLHVMGVKVDIESPEYPQLQFEFLQTLVETIELQQRRLKGEVIRVDAVAPIERVLQPAHTVQDAEVSFDSLFNLWNKRQADRPEATLRIYRQAWGDFEKFVGHNDAGKVVKADVIRYVEHLEAKGGHYKTVSKKLGVIRTLFTRALNQDVLTKNPSQGVEVTLPSQRQQKARVPYTAADIQAIFSSPVFTDDARSNGCGGEAAKWLPILGYYSGARLEELAQLRVRDIHHKQGLGWFMNLTDEGPNQRLKNQGSRRRVPLRDEVLRLGFLEYLETQREANHELLFSALTPDSKGCLSGNWSKWWGRYSRSVVGIVDPRRVYHSLRHGFKHFCRGSQISRELHDVLTGHAGHRSASDEYGEELYPLEPLFIAMRQIQFPEIPLLSGLSEAGGGESPPVF